MQLDPSLDLPDPKSLDFTKEKKVHSPRTPSASPESASPSKRKSDAATSVFRSIVGSLSRANEPGRGGVKGALKDQARGLVDTVKMVKKQVRSSVLPALFVKPNTK